MVANGHSDAETYVLGRIFDEAQLAVDRRNSEFVTLAIMVQAATATTAGTAANKDTQKAFQNLLKHFDED